ncbi:MAG: PKD-like domain-containing protein, partial [Dolichospermum sp.]
MTGNATVVVLPMPLITNKTDTTCSDVALNYNLDALISGSGDTYTYTVLSSNQAQVPAGTPRTVASANAIIENYTNTTGADVVITYVITPIGQNGCSGTPFNLAVTVKSEPVVTNKSAITCSDLALNYDLGSLITGTGDTYTYSVASSNQTQVPAGTPRTLASATNITDTYTNTTGADVIITYTITPIGQNGCIGNPFNLLITVKPEPVISNQTSTICSDLALNYDLGSLITGTGDIYTYSVASSNQTQVPAGTPRTLASATNITDTYTNTTGADVIITYTITPIGQNGCIGNPFNLLITVKPEPVISNQTSTICSDVALNYNLDALISGSGDIYTYTVLSSNQILVPAGDPRTVASASAITDIYTNRTGVDVLITYTITPVDLNGCIGNPFNLLITVKPEAIISNQTVTICSGVALNYDLTPLIFGNGDKYSYSSITSSDPINVPPGIPRLVPSSSNIMDVYVNNTSAPVTITYTILPQSANGCYGDAFDLVATINPKGQVDQPISQVVCTNTATASIDFSTINTGGTTSFSWTNTLTSIGLAASGTGNIPSFTAVTGTSPVVATITVTPTFTNGIRSCQGNPKAFNITVNPKGQVNQPINQTVCHSAPISEIVFSTNNTGGTTTYEWSIDSNIGLVSQSGIGNIPAFTAINTGLLPIVATITVTPTFNNSGRSCSGPTKTFTITVNPSPSISTQPRALQSICVGGTITPLTVAYTGGFGTPTYQWYTNTTGVINPALDTVLVGSNSNSYLPPSAISNTVGTYYYYAVVTLSGSGCGTAVSN